jgi:hypothetical protein
MQNDHIYGLLMNHKKKLLFYSKKGLKEANIPKFCKFRRYILTLNIVKQDK